MKKFALVSIISLLVVGMFSLGVFAEPVTVWDTATGEVAENARAYSQYPLLDQSCNKEVWEVEWTTHASVAQWVSFSFTGTRWNWYIRKPGDYYADCIAFSGKSNGDVVVTFDGFEDLQYQADGGVKQTIDTYYYAAPDVEQPDGDATDWGWVRAADLSEVSWNIEDSQDLHDGETIKLWNRLVVEECNSACEYEDRGVISITLLNQKDWIDGETGTYQEEGWTNTGWNPSPPAPTNVN